jgi:3-isopropylmalate dehydrogenase
MATHKLFLLPGDGIGPEVMAEVEKVAAWFGKAGLVSFEIEKGLVGGSAYDAHGKAISDSDMALAKAADAVLLAAVGGPKWDDVPYDVRPEAGLLRLRKDLQLFANLRPAICYPALADASSLKREVIEGLDIMIIRELTGGVYFGEPKQIIDLGNGQKRGIDTQVYDTYEIERIGRVAFDLARKRGGRVTSSDKRNVMKSGVLWHDVMKALHAREFTDVTFDHMLADSLGMQLVRWPKQFDVIVTDNLARRSRDKLRQTPCALRAGARLGARHRRERPRQPYRHDCLARHGLALLVQPRRRGRSGRQGHCAGARRRIAHGGYQGRGALRHLHHRHG